MARRKALCFIVFGWLIPAVLVPPAVAGEFEENNRFRPGTFPAKVETTAFSIPLESDTVLVILPPALMTEAGQPVSSVR